MRNKCFAKVVSLREMIKTYYYYPKENKRKPSGIRTMQIMNVRIISLMDLIGK
jgi:hypothetical protein